MVPSLRGADFFNGGTIEKLTKPIIRCLCKDVVKKALAFDADSHTIKTVLSIGARRLT
jgi:hypothetical protein